MFSHHTWKVKYRFLNESKINSSFTTTNNINIPKSTLANDAMGHFITMSPIFVLLGMMGNRKENGLSRENNKKQFNELYPTNTSIIKFD